MRSNLPPPPPPPPPPAPVVPNAPPPPAAGWQHPEPVYWTTVPVRPHPAVTVIKVLAIITVVTVLLPIVLIGGMLTIMSALMGGRR